MGAYLSGCDRVMSSRMAAPRPTRTRRRLSVCARDLYRLCKLFGGTAAQALAAYGLMERLLEEQCQVIKKKQRPSRDDDDAGEGGVPVVLRVAKEVSSASLQSPHDPDATYSGHKGKATRSRSPRRATKTTPWK